MQSYVTTDGQSASLSWNIAPIWGLRPDFYYCQTVVGLLMWGALSDERTGLSFTVAAGPRQRGTRDHIFLSQIWETSLFVAYYDSQGTVEVLDTPPPHGISTTQSQSQSYIATDGRSISKSWCRAPSGAHDQICITVWQLRSCFCEAPSLTRGRVCRLYMLLALVSALFLGSESLGTRDRILLSQFWDFPWSGFPVICQDGPTENIFHFLSAEVFVDHPYPVSTETPPRNGLVSRNPSPHKHVCRPVPWQWVYTSQYEWISQSNSVNTAMFSFVVSRDVACKTILLGSFSAQLSF
jgi:hypothetical protein